MSFRYLYSFRTIIIAGLLIAQTIFPATPAISAEPGATTPTTAKPAPFKTGERIGFEVKMLGLRVGCAWLEVADSPGGIPAVDGLPPVPGENFIVIRSLARTIGWIEHFYKMRDVITAWIDPITLEPRRFSSRISEGDFRKRESLDYDRAANTVNFSRNDSPREIFAVMPGTHDSLSGIFEFRSRALATGKNETTPVFADKKNYVLVSDILAREPAETALGTFDSFKVHPQLKHQGIFQRRGEVYVWLAADDHKTPVKIESKLIIGAFTGTAVTMRGSTTNPVSPPKPADPEKEPNPCTLEETYLSGIAEAMANK